MGSREDMEGEAAAASALAEAYKTSGAISDAVEYFLRSLDIAEKTENVNAQADACSNLGTIYNSQRDFSEAVKMFQRSYDLARVIVNTTKGRRSLLDTARVNLGMARGNERMEVYSNAINHDLNKL